jgi:hypothetical protein
MKLLPILFGFVYFFVITLHLIQYLEETTYLGQIVLAIIISILPAITEFRECKKQPKQNERPRMEGLTFFSSFLVVLRLS